MISGRKEVTTPVQGGNIKPPSRSVSKIQSFEPSSREYLKRFLAPRCFGELEETKESDRRGTQGADCCRLALATNPRRSVKTQRSTTLCLQRYHPWCSALGHPVRMCAVETEGLEHRRHRAVWFRPQRRRLDGQGRPWACAFMTKLNSLGDMRRI